MIDRASLLDEVRAANPITADQELPVDAVGARPPLATVINRTVTEPEPLPATTPARVGWRGPLIAVGTAAAILVVVVMMAAVLVDSSDVSDTATTVATTTTVASETTVPTAEAWNPILTTTRAQTPPPAATCPAGTDPNAPGPADQQRPQPAPYSNQAAVFDRHTGRIVYVDEAAETWTFDVCTNTWQQMNPEGVPPADEDRFDVVGEPTVDVGELVYDVDSDHTISFGNTLAVYDADTLAVYDANTNTWTQRYSPPEYGFRAPGLGAVYDPVSGLVILQTLNEGLVVYDVGTDEWSSLGPIDGASQIVGYVAETDRLVFVAFTGDGLLIDPRSGASTHFDRLPADHGGGLGRFHYATSAETAYALSEDVGGGVCRLDPATLDWACIAPTDGPGYQGYSAMVGDPINDRLVLINGCCGMNGEHTDDLWAVDVDTGEWTQLLAPTQP